MNYPDINNAVLKKCRKALKLNDRDLWHIWSLGGLELSKNAARTFFVGQQNKNYRRCSDDDLLRFFDGLIEYDILDALSKYEAEAAADEVFGDPQNPARCRKLVRTLLNNGMLPDILRECAKYAEEKK